MDVILKISNRGKFPGNCGHFTKHLLWIYNEDLEFPRFVQEMWEWIAKMYKLMEIQIDDCYFGTNEDVESF